MDKLQFKPKTLFLIDSIGALLTAVILIIIKAYFNERFGIPWHTVYILSSIAFIFALYSFSCYYFLKHKWQPYLITIGIANFLYCCSTAALIFIHYDNLTKLAVAYFAFEILIMCCLVFIELKVATVETEI